ncbi:Putative endonuclease [Ignavibacterium album JCM 16511]|uniref:Putative pre-16S rRNA nuclease n=1 Tax=Ignavibacterium album (strain DSM 19864 / JCM 16511 / NBRC 101810 / Mat9-16) TaxID=945713 RepID=I0AJD2_IGNAJ|nr:Holliday junction resolvase RuvX [Ignavibacterium album]AFH49089.1 Putative endonuclease [Ignavibacterium album JCM 16511]
MIEENLTRIMAIDFGLKRIGIALSDPLKKFASPFTTLRNDEKLFHNLKKIIQEKAVEKIILGLPDKSDDSTKSVYKNVLEFKSELEKQFNLEIIMWNETHTSRIAEQRIIDSVKSKKKRQDKGLIDMHSAAIILSEYLDSIDN